MYTIQPEVSKTSIFEQIPQEKIFEKYLGITVQFKELVCSPLRRDKSPTCSFNYASSGILYFHDFSGHFWGNCIDLVMYIYAVNYTKALEIIASDFDLIKMELGEIPRLKTADAPEPVLRERARFEIEWRKYTAEDGRYWRRMHITEKELRRMKVAAVKTLWINGYLHYTYSSFNPAYAIVLAPGEYKVYFPTNFRTKFLCNTQRVMGWDQLPEKGPLCVITKSFKDITVLNKFSIPAVSWHSETILPDKERIEELQRRFDNVFSLYDFDLTGIRTANKMRKVYGIHPLFFTNGRFGYHDCKAKDSAEYIEKHGVEGSKQLVDNFFKVMIYD